MLKQRSLQPLCPTLQTGYREGITAGKLSTLQSGFDQGFNEVGAPIGRIVGQLRGQVSALVTIINLHAEAQEKPHPNPVDQSGADSPPTAGAHATPGRGRAGVRGVGAARPRGDGMKSKPVFPFLSNPALPSAREQLVQLQNELYRLGLDQLAEPDYEALEHEREHADQAGPLSRETDDEVRSREQILPALQQRLQNVYDMLGIDMA